MVGRGIALLCAFLFVLASPAGAQPLAAADPSGERDVSTSRTVKTERRIEPPALFEHIDYTDGLPNSNVTSIVQDKIGFMWFATQDGLARYDGARMRVYRPIDNDPTSISAAFVTALALDDKGRLWAGTEKGLVVYDPDTDRFTRFSAGAKGGLSSAGVSRIHRDAKNRMWFVMSGGGIDKYDPGSNTFSAYLTDTAVTAIGSDASGTLWLGTESDGVIKWNPDDGKTQAYPLNEDGGEASDPISSVLVASDGRIWLGTDGAGLAAIESKTLKVVRYRSGPDEGTISDDHVTSSLYEDRDKNIWFGTQNGLNEIKKDGTIVRYHHDPNDPMSLAFEGVESIYQDTGGIMWIGGFVLGLCKLDPARSRFGRYKIRDVPPTTFYEDPDGTIWVGSYHGGLWKLDFKEARATIYSTLGRPGSDDAIDLETTWIPAVLRDKTGTMWLSLQGQGVIAFNTKTEEFKHYAPNPDDANAIPVDTIWSIVEDAKGQLWFATWGGGLVKYDRAHDAFTSFTTENVTGMTSDRLYSIQIDPKNPAVLWLAAGKGGVMRFDTAAGSATSFRSKEKDPKTLSSDDVLSLYVQADGTVWAGTYGGGLNRITTSSGAVERFTKANSGLTNDVIYGILPDDAGNLWLSTNGGGLLRFNPKDKKWDVYDVSDGIAGKEFAQGGAKRTKAGLLIFGGSESAFNMFDPKAITRDPYAPPIALTGFKLGNQEVRLQRPIWTLPKIEVGYSDTFEIEFAGLSYAAPEKNRYSYKLEGYDDTWTETDRPFASYKKLDGGNYTLRVRAANRHGVWGEKAISLPLHVKPPFWRTWPAYIVYLVVLAGIIALVFYLQRLRVSRIMAQGRLAVVERDIALTGAVQNGFLPEYNELSGGRFNLFGFYRGAESCSGDWWWHENINGRHLVLVGDVTGHGPGPAMVTAAVASAFRILVTETGIPDLAEALLVLNRVVLQVAKGKYSMTMAAIELDEQTGQWQLLSAGAPPIMSLNNRGKHRVYFAAGTPLGTETGYEVGHVEGRLQPGERLLLYTDGIPEIMLPNGQPLGMRRLGQMYERTRDSGLRDAAAAIVQQADLTQSGKPQEDDWTFAIVEWRGIGAPMSENTELPTNVAGSGYYEG